MTIRPAHAADVAAVMTCESTAFAPFAAQDDMHDAKHRRDLAAQIEAGLVYVIGTSAVVDGCMTMWPTTGHLFIETLAVRPARHHRGLGSQLLAFAEREAARLQLSSVRLFTKESMADNVGFYQRRGYRETGRCDDDGFARVFYIKNVSLCAPDVGGSALAM